MELIRGIHNLRPRHRGCVATIGNFDGVHLGHQAVLGQLAEMAEELGLPTCVITFEPQPNEFFARGEVPPRLTRLREKARTLVRYAVNRLLVLRFGSRLCADERRCLYSAAAFRTAGHTLSGGWRRLPFWCRARGRFRLVAAARRRVWL
jgi:cytidyltransferase-like protein